MESPFTAAGRVEQQVEELKREVEGKAYAYDLESVRRRVASLESDVRGLRSELSCLEHQVLRSLEKEKGDL